MSLLAAVGLLPEIVGVATKIAPGLLRLLGSDSAAETVETVTKVAQDVLGTTDPQEAEEKLAANPALKEQFLARLTSDTERYRAALEDTQSARQQTVDLAKIGSPIAYGSVIVSVIVTIAFSVVLGLFMYRPYAISGPAEAVLNILVGTLAAAFTQVVNYWLGSSAGSAAKDAMIRAGSAVVPTAAPKKAAAPAAKKS